MTKWEKEPCISCPVANQKIDDVTDLLKKLEACEACKKVDQDGCGK